MVHRTKPQPGAKNRDTKEQKQKHSAIQWSGTTRTAIMDLMKSVVVFHRVASTGTTGVPLAKRQQAQVELA